MKTYKKLLSTVTFIVVAAILLTGTAFAAEGEAYVTASALNMREGSSQDYNIIDVAPQGSQVYVNYDDGNGWVQVTYNGRTGYMSAEFLTFGEAPVVTETYTETYTAPAPAASGSGNGSIYGNEVRMRSGPSLESPVLTYLYTGYSIQINGACGAWYEIVYNGMTGYVYGDYVLRNGESKTYTVSVVTTNEPAVIYTEPATTESAVVVEEASVQVNPLAGQSIFETVPEQQVVVQEPVIEQPVIEQPAVQPSTAVGVSSYGQAALAIAEQQLGIPYVWAGSKPETGFDCSGLVYYCYGQLGVSLNRVAQAMYYNGVDVDISDYSNLQAGDILLFGSSVYNIWHAAMYVGGGTFIHAPSSGYKVSYQSLNDTYGMRLVAARRIF